MSDFGVNWSGSTDVNVEYMVVGLREGVADRCRVVVAEYKSPLDLDLEKRVIDF